MPTPAEIERSIARLTIPSTDTHGDVVTAVVYKADLDIVLAAVAEAREAGDIKALIERLVSPALALWIYQPSRHPVGYYVSVLTSGSREMIAEAGGPDVADALGLLAAALDAQADGGAT